MSESALERALATGLRVYGRDIPPPDREVCVVPGRKLRWDFVWREQRLLVEVNGGIFAGRSAHNGASLLRDFDKANAAAAHGWRVMFFAAPHLRSRQLAATVETIRQALFA